MSYGKAVRDELETHDLTVPHPGRPVDTPARLEYPPGYLVPSMP